MGFVGFQATCHARSSWPICGAFRTRSPASRTHTDLLAGQQGVWWLVSLDPCPCLWNRKRMRNGGLKMTGTCRGTGVLPDLGAISMAYVIVPRLDSSQLTSHPSAHPSCSFLPSNFCCHYHPMFGTAHMVARKAFARSKQILPQLTSTLQCLRTPAIECNNP